MNELCQLAATGTSIRIIQIVSLVLLIASLVVIVRYRRKGLRLFVVLAIIAIQGMPLLIPSRAQAATCNPAKSSSNQGGQSDEPVQPRVWSPTGRFQSAVFDGGDIITEQVEYGEGDNHAGDGETFSTIDSFTTGAHIFDEATPTGGDIDTDGVDDRLEDAAPNNGDANENGIPDAEERNVVSFPNAQKDNKYAVIELDDQCAITTAAAQAGSALSTKDTAYDYPAGMLNFSADCGEAGYTTDVTIYQYGLAKGSLVLRKHNPSTKAYSTVSGAVIEEATTNGQSLLKATYQVTDGGALDVDGLVDGIIVDPAGFGQVTVGVPNTGFSKR